MPAPTTREQFLDLVRQSGLLAADELAQRVNDPAAPLPDGPREVAELFIREKLLTNFQAQRLLWGQFRGFLLGNYRVLDQIGAGGMGAVYLCEHRSLARRVAIKVLPPDRCQDALTVERFYREARAVAALNHPNIVRAFDVDSVGNLHFLVMEYVEGRTLHELVHKHGPQDVGRAAGYVRQAALGLQHVHEAGLVHRDVKPGNLLRDKHGVIKLLDLGLARFFTANDEGLTRKFDDKSILGTADYIAPEQAMNSHDVDIRADIYSLGATFYHLLTGRPPFEGGSVAQKLLWHQMRNPEPVRAVRPEVPEELAAVLDRMMLKNPDRRFQTPAEVAAALAPWVPGSSAGMSGTRLSGSVAKLTLPPEPELIAEPPRDQSGIFDWDAIADGATTDPNGAGRTLKDGKGRGGPKSHRKRPAAAGRRRLAVIAAVAGGLLVLGVGVGGAWWAMARARPGEVPARPAAAAPPGVQPGGLLVVQAGGGDGAFPTLREALAQARPGQRVQVRGDLEEAVKLEGPGLHDLVLEGVPRDPKAEPRLAAWRPPANHPAGQPLLQVTGVPGLRVKGFLFDGQNRVQDGLAVAGVCPGLTVEDCQIQGCQRAGVVLRAARGEGKRPLTLDRVRVVGSEKAAGEAAVLLAPGKNADDPVQYVTVRRCRFEGPFAAALAIAAPTVNLEFLRNRVHEVGAGLLYRKAEVPRDLHGVVDGNTFHAVQTGLLFESLPPAAEGANWLWVRHNLFVQVPRLTAVAGFQTEPATVAGHWIWADEGNPAAEAPKGVRYFRKRFDLAQVPAGPVLLNVVCDDAGAVFLNGQPIIHPRWDVQPRRVYAVDVRDKLRPGANVLAVEAENTGGPAGLFVQLQAAAAAPLAVTDGGWRYQAQKAANWEKPEFAEEGWSPVKDLGPYRPAPNPAWANLLWDAEVLRQRGSLSPLLTNQSKNFHDGKGVDGYPFVLAAPVEVTLYTNPLQDAKFLRYDYYHPLRDAGENKAPVGVPMD